MRPPLRCFGFPPGPDDQRRNSYVRSAVQRPSWEAGGVARVPSAQLERLIVEAQSETELIFLIAR
jgi:hypothetical protein